MADTIVEVVLDDAASGLTLELYADGSDVLANSGGADTLTEETNRKGLYLATVQEALSGLHYAKILDGAEVYAAGWVDLADDTGTYTIREDKVAFNPASDTVSVGTIATDAITAASLSAAGIAKIEAALLNEGDGQALIDAIVQAIDAADIDTDILPALIRDAILNRVLAGNHDTVGTVGKVLQDVLADTAEVQADLANGGRLDAILDATQAAAERLTAPRAAVLDDWIDAGRLDALLDSAVTQATAAATEVGKVPRAAAAVTAGGSIRRTNDDNAQTIDETINGNAA